MNQPPDAPALVANASGAAWLEPGGAARTMAHADAALAARAGPPPLLCHAPATAAKLGCARFPALDLLELFAFVRPAEFCLPTVRGLAAALGLAPPDGLLAEAALLPEAARLLLKSLKLDDDDARREAAPIAAAMARGGWPWAGLVQTVLGPAAQAGMDVWNRLPEWSEQAPQGQAGGQPVAPAEARARLTALLGSDAEPRPQQADYTSAVCASFQPREADGEALVTLAEAGTGVGKTLGYIAAASLWAEKNQSPVWLSTFTKNLQRQIDQELDSLYPEPALKARKVVIRKGRENYLCLLNLEDAARAVGGIAESAVAVGLMARWARATRDGDMVGGDFPAWLVGLVGHGRTLGLADRRGECIYSACPHYRKCFIERGVRRARRADLVIANHALVMTQAALHGIGGSDDSYLPQRYVFGAGHHAVNAPGRPRSAPLPGRQHAEPPRQFVAHVVGDHQAVFGIDQIDVAAQGKRRPTAQAQAQRRFLGHPVPAAAPPITVGRPPPPAVGILQPGGVVTRLGGGRQVRRHPFQGARFNPQAHCWQVRGDRHLVIVKRDQKAVPGITRCVVGQGREAKGDLLNGHIVVGHAVV